MKSEGGKRGISFIKMFVKRFIYPLIILGVLLFSFAWCLTCFAGEATGSYNLEDCIRISLAEHQSVRQAQSLVRQYEANVLQARSQQLPHVDFDTSWINYKWLPPNKQKIIGGGTTDVYLEIALRQILYSGGREHAQMDQAKMDLLTAQEGLRRTRQAVVFQVKRAFFLLRQAEELLKSKQEAVNQIRVHLDIARKRLAVGTAREVDVLRAEVQFADVEQAKIAAENSVAVARMRLNTAMGRAVDTPLEIADSAHTPQAPEAPEVTLAEALQSHPEWIQSELALRRAEAGLTIAQSLAMPDLGFGAAYNLEGGSFPPDIDNWNIGLRLNIPLWDSGNAVGAKGAARERIEQAKAGQELLRQRLGLAVEEARVTMSDAKERMRVTALSADEARRTLRIEQERYRVGAGSSIEVIDAQVALTRAETNAIQATYDYRIALAQLEYALGRDPVLITDQGSQSRATGGNE